MLNIKIIYILILCLFVRCSKDVDYLFGPDYSMFNSSLNFEGDEDTLDIITWNIENYPKDNSTNFFVSQIIDSLNVDIIALQEIKDQASLTNLTESLGNNWYSYKSGSASSDWQELAFLINTAQVDIITNPYTILNNYDYEFASREPLVLECSYNNQLLILINVHYKSDWDGDWSERRLAANNLLYDYINNNYPTENVVVLGDFNDVLTDVNNNVFIDFLSDNNNYYFADSQIATSSNQNWSYPSWPSHIDHILITNELTDNIYNTQTILIDYSLNGSLVTYMNYISDHRPVGIQLFFNP